MPGSNRAATTPSSSASASGCISRRCSSCRSAARSFWSSRTSRTFTIHSRSSTGPRIFESTDGTPRHVRFVLGNDPASLSLNVTQVVRGLSPALLDGVYIFTHYYSSVLENAKERFQRDFRLCLTGLGYFEDELIMTANAAGNLARCPLALLEGLHPERDEPVLIVGSGPSIDGDMGFLVENAERAVIISIGTGLAGLLAAGIRPDFHVELENTLINERMVRLTDEEFGLHGVTLLGSMTVLPELAARFGDTIMFFRELLTSTMLFGENCGTVSPSGPTVANAALVSAIMMGFRSIYLFGVDMGTRSRSSYHSEGSLYGRGRVADCALDEQMHVAPANFGGEAYAEQVLVWSRSVLEVTLRSHPTVRCYNCSDGVRIAYAIPKVTRVVDLPPQPIDRRAVVDAIRGNLVVYSDERRRRVWDHGERRAEAEAFFAHLCTIIDRAALQPDPGRGWIHELCEAIEHDGPAPVPLWSFLHGSISLMLGTTWWYERRLTSPEAQRRFRRMAMSELRIAIEAMASRLAQLYDDVDEFFAGNLDRVPVTYVD